MRILRAGRYTRLGITTNTKRVEPLSDDDNALSARPTLVIRGDQRFSNSTYDERDVHLASW